MGGFSLKVNIAKFAAENAERWVEDNQRKKEGKSVLESDKGFQGVAGAVNSWGVNKGWIKEGVSFKDMLKKGGNSEEAEVRRKEVEVHSETAAFFDLQGRALVGRAFDISSLTKLRTALLEAGVSELKIHYLGGLSILISFDDDITAADFLLEVNLWNKWFTSLDMWTGQSMQYERVAWLKFHGLPLHLAENKVFDDTASLFGKVIHKSQLSLSDRDLSVNYVGILVDHGERISDSVILKWRNRRYKVWITEERDNWVPDCLSEEDWPVNNGGEEYTADNQSSEHEKTERLQEETEEMLVHSVVDGVPEVDGNCNDYGNVNINVDTHVKVGGINNVSSNPGEKKKCKKKKTVQFKQG
ncbi:hypothetical protein HanPI659440_Chr02g0037791 [Helianthus annuus]|nr:hypothetical protein HanPI659440_Chr02g0037791 [Helianthus annuus]